MNMHVVTEIGPETVRQAQGRALAVVQLGDEYETVSFDPTSPLALQGELDALAERLLEQEMGSYEEEDTGIRNVIYISPRGRTRHDARIKVAIDPWHTFNPNEGKNCSVSVETGEYVVGEPMNGKLAARVKRFVELNRETLFLYWEYQLSTKAMEARLRRVED